MVPGYGNYITRIDILSRLVPHPFLGFLRFSTIHKISRSCNGLPTSLKLPFWIDYPSIVTRNLTTPKARWNDGRKHFLPPEKQRFGSENFFFRFVNKLKCNLAPNALLSSHFVLSNFQHEAGNATAKGARFNPWGFLQGWMPAAFILFKNPEVPPGAWQFSPHSDTCPHTHT